MKKLLVILLLFFPVHGAWAELINIDCHFTGAYAIIENRQEKVDIKKNYRIDTKKKIVDNGWPLSYLDDFSFGWWFGSSTDKFYLQSYKLSRSTGAILIYQTIDLTALQVEPYLDALEKGNLDFVKTPKFATKYSGNCSKGTGKKKF